MQKCDVPLVHPGDGPAVHRIFEASAYKSERLVFSFRYCEIDFVNWALCQYATLMQLTTISKETYYVLLVWKREACWVRKSLLQSIERFILLFTQ